jgi:large subunit ribosomal protein L5
VAAKEKQPKDEAGEKAAEAKRAAEKGAEKAAKKPAGEKPAKASKGKEGGGKEGGRPSTRGSVAPRLKERFHKEILPGLAEQFGRQNRLSLPYLRKITINMGVGTATVEKKHLEEAVAALTQIAGQKAVTTIARKSIAGFKLREGQPIGCKVTLRGNRMWEFLDRLLSLALPRVRDFRGLNPDAFDGRGNYSLGLSEQLAFPELNPDKYTRPQGMNITLVFSTNNDQENREVLKRLGMPFRTEQQPASKA